MVKKTAKRTLNTYSPLLYAAICFSIIMAGIGIYVSSKPDSAASAFTKATTHQPETFSELYFNNYEAIPKLLDPGKVYAGSFTITNREHSDRTYIYEVIVIENGKVTGKARNTIFLANNQNTQLPFTFAAKSEGSTLQIRIELVDYQQHITFRTSS